MDAISHTDVRQATSADLDRIVDLGAEFLAYGPYAFIELDREAFRQACANLIENGVIFISDEGMLGGLLNPLYFAPTVSMGAELFWWAPRGGRQLRLAFERWAQEKGAIGVQFSGLMDSRLDTSRKLFERAGFRPTEVGYLKVFG